MSTDLTTASDLVVLPSAPGLRESARLYKRSARRQLRKYGIAPSRALRRLDQRPVFIVGSPRSGTSFVAESIGTMPGFCEVGELGPLKRRVPRLAGQPPTVAARTIRTVMSRVQRLGLMAGRRIVETTPECTYLIPALSIAYPEACFVHMIRDGRDVAASLVGLGWLKDDEETLADDVGHPLGNAARFWVEPERRREFSQVAEAVRAAWVWRRYETMTQANLATRPGQWIEIRYEDLVDKPDHEARRLALFLGAQDHTDVLVETVSSTLVRSARGRWRRELSAAALDEIASEAGDLLTELGYL